MTPAKPWYTSATLWFNAISVVVMIAGVLADTAGLFPGLSDTAAAQIAVGAGAVVAIGNGLLRLFKTAQPLEIAGKVPAIASGSGKSSG